MPTLVCTKCGSQAEVQQRGQAPFYCRSCKTLARQQEKMQDMACEVQVARSNDKIHAICIEENAAGISALQREVAALKQEQELLKAERVRQESEERQQRLKLESEERQLKLKLESEERQLKLKLESEARENERIRESEMQKIKLQNEFDLEKLKIEEQKAVEIAQLNTEAKTQEALTAQAEAAKAKAEASVNIKKEMNKALEKVSKTKNPQAAIAVIKHFRDAAEDDQSTTSTLSSDDIMSSYATENAPDDPLAFGVNENWTKLHRKVNTAPCDNAHKAY
ncbi:PREDICTED: myb-like protein X [Amphimedon queenslandica]|uniref:Uncharacterized protein n=1 Tax=Amphimedon queenslandica TaxID=400682 RepID=A0A1X7TKJ9_AMPQE|nr:PREDICTED: myb-like protein X [Amphimedon queenslandica]|eukprot:XP_019859164.1 PREDICTED: myb-like protein X [Amphimedon queenslandica]